MYHDISSKQLQKAEWPPEKTNRTTDRADGRTAAGAASRYTAIIWTAGNFFDILVE